MRYYYYYYKQNQLELLQIVIKREHWYSRNTGNSRSWKYSGRSITIICH